MPTTQATGDKATVKGFLDAVTTTDAELTSKMRRVEVTR
jgi:hypothetical protein